MNTPTSRDVRFERKRWNIYIIYIVRPYWTSEWWMTKYFHRQLLVISKICFSVVIGTLANEASLPCKERTQGSRHSHIMSGCPPPLYWLVTWLYDSFIYGVVTVVPIIIVCLIYDKDATFTRRDFLCKCNIVYSCYRDTFTKT